jgi:hypothetical protein
MNERASGRPRPIVPHAPRTKCLLLPRERDGHTPCTLASMARLSTTVGGLMVMVGLFSGCSGASSSVPPEGAGDAAAPSSDASSVPPPDAMADAAAGACGVVPAVFDGRWLVGTSGGTTFHRFDHPAPKGLVVALHGTNGSSVSVATKKKEWQSFHAAARARGYSVLVPESEQRDKPRRWDNAPSADNADLVRIASLIEEARRTGGLPSTAPIYVVGMSQGAGVAPIFGQLLASRGFPVRAVAAYCGGSSPVFARPEYTLPTVFAAMANDDVIVDSAAAVASNVAALEARRVETLAYVKPAEKLCPERFTRIPGVDAAASLAIVDGLRAAQVVAADGTILTHGSDLEGAAPPGIPPELSAFSDDIDEQLQVVAAGHAFFGDRNDATLAFFAAHP